MTSIHDACLGQILDALFATNLNQVFSAVALKALGTSAISIPWLHQDTTTISLYGAYADIGAASDAPRTRRPRAAGRGGVAHPAVA